ncbi:DUF3304 domain-containing protein [Pseudoduganella sp. LjRoot289]|uniref:DUF3304 domain-containing protein n=1 Tax=Pseudoduganella sp. LjRoot289 TaxID=3342314 RepID=UPI003ECFE65C
MCCYALPAKWRAGIKVQINGKHWLAEKPDGSLPEVKETKIVEVPPYVNGKPGELWVLRGADGTLSLVSSDFQPDHAKWPGTVKGWPIPSLEYKRARWDLYIKIEQDLLDSYKESIQELAKSPDKHAEEVWNITKERFPETIQSYKSSGDKKYREFLLEKYQIGLAEAQAKVQGLKDQRP